MKYTYCLTISKSNKKYTSFEELNRVLFEFCVALNIHLIDYGYHITGKLANYAHIHGLVETDHKLWLRYHQAGPINIAILPFKNRIEYYHNYMHNQDHQCPYQRENMILENYYMHKLHKY